jgi:hypothetical protein
MSYQKEINKMLMDGKWHSFEEIHKANYKHIDATVADKEYRKRHDTWKTDPVSLRVSKGKRRLVILHLISLKSRLQVEGRGPSGDQEFRMTKDEIKKRRKKEQRRMMRV